LVAVDGINHFDTHTVSFSTLRRYFVLSGFMRQGFRQNELWLANGAPWGREFIPGKADSGI
jgi:hypothetical protein